ncbi:MAG: hypothetical protein HY914_03410 [Desulfomonile tiedjei]|nr:hypothetical protein [Desulfomonile tiedjei]
MISRELVGKQFPPFSVRISQSFVQELLDLTKIPELPPLPPWPPPSSWPALLTAHGTACLMEVWEELGIDPLRVRLVEEECQHFLDPVPGETLAGSVTVGEVTQHLEPSRGIEEQVELDVVFQNSATRLVATYRCVFRVPLMPHTQSQSEG